MEKEGYLKLLVGLVIAVAILSLIAIGVANGSKVDEKALADKITTQVLSKIDIPTAAEIAAQIPPVNVTIPDVKNIDNKKVNDLWESLYPDEVQTLKDNTYNVVETDLTKHDYKVLENYLKSKIANFDEITEIEIKDSDITIVELGLDKEDDKVATGDFEVKVWYSLTEGSNDDYHKTLDVNADVTFNEGDFDDEEIVLTIK